ncbi:TetR/AcrR family transcriptional regulator [Kocuria carniphila]|uniref:TetR/AcrR family transcriptional regulator n=1 Tax=Kocuria carniphila TaxID=262208 RepID=UPI0021A27918|nr:TetR/AcrR family transcriptional regulator [Kocuria carniphila]MCT1804103.1 TetR/AcrR family transcriptional regulator [Kocuria carniphila]
MKRSAEDARKTKQTILGSSLGAFEEHGWRGATFDVIARAAGLSRGALNHHFASKSELLSEALQFGWSEFGDKLFADDTTSASAAENLRVLLRRYIEWLQDDPKFRALVSTTVIVAPQASSSGNAEKSDALTTWKNQIEKCLSLGEPLAVPRDRIARNVVVFLQGLAVTAITNPEDLPSRSELVVTVDYLVHGFLGSGLTSQ